MDAVSLFNIGSSVVRFKALQTRRRLVAIDPIAIDRLDGRP
jgi:hypothetical protein